LTSKHADKRDDFDSLRELVGCISAMSGRYRPRATIFARKSMIILFYISGNARSSLPMRAICRVQFHHGKTGRAWWRNGVPRDCVG